MQRLARLLAAAMLAVTLAAYVAEAAGAAPISADGGASYTVLAELPHPYADGLDADEIPAGSDGVQVFEDGSYITEAGEHGCLELAPCSQPAEAGPVLGAA